MKKYFILFAAVAMFAMTACNEKPAKDNADQSAESVDKVEKIDQSKLKTAKSKLEKVAPTADGKSEILAQFKTDDYEVTMENTGDGTVRVTLKGDKGDQVYESKSCRVQGDGYLMQTTDGKNILMNGAEKKIVILGEKEIIYKGVGH